MKSIRSLLALVPLLALAETPQPTTPAKSAPTEKRQPGLLGRYYQFDYTLSDFPDVATDKKPDLERVDKQIRFPSTQEAWAGTSFVDNFYVRWTGSLLVPKAGTYTFFLDSDDGSKLTVDGKQVAANEGTHDMMEISAKVELTSGEHEIKFDYFESEIDSGCILSWQGPGLAKQVIPVEALSHPAAATPAKPAK